MQEEDNTQSGGQVGGARNIRGHHWDKRHIRPVKVPIEYRKWDQEGEGVKEVDEHAAKAIHAYRHHVAQHAILLQTPRGKEIYQYWALIKHLAFISHTKTYLQPLLTACP